MPTSTPDPTLILPLLEASAEYQRLCAEKHGEFVGVNYMGGSHETTRYRVAIPTVAGHSIWNGVLIYGWGNTVEAAYNEALTKRATAERDAEIDKRVAAYREQLLREGTPAVGPTPV